MNGQRLKKMIRSAGYTQSTFAEKIGVNSVTVSRWVTEEREPRDSVKLLIAETLGVSVDYLMGLNTQETKDAPVSYSENRGVNVGIQFNNSPVTNTGTITQEAHVREFSTYHCTTRQNGGILEQERKTTPEQELTTEGKQDGAVLLSRSDFFMIPILSSNGDFSGKYFPFPLPDQEYLYGASLSNLFAMKVQDSMMERYLFDGDYVVCEKTESVQQGQLVVCKLFNSCIVRGIRRDADNNINLLVVGNKSFADTEIDNSNRSCLTVLGRVVRIYRPSIAPGVLM